MESIPDHYIVQSTNWNSTEGYEKISICFVNESSFLGICVHNSIMIEIERCHILAVHLVYFTPVTTRKGCTNIICQENEVMWGTQLQLGGQT